MIDRIRVHVRTTYGYYLINRRYYPDLNRPQAVWSAVRTWWMTRAHIGDTDGADRRD